MNHEQEERIRALTELIANERDHDKIKVLATELESLLTADGTPLPTQEKPQSS
jgi:hypothetical protein